MAVKLGNVIYARIGGVKLVAQQEVSLEASCEMADITSKASGAWSEVEPTRLGGSISVSGLYDPEATTGEFYDWADLWAAFINRTKVAISVGESATGKYVHSCYAYIESLSHGAPMDDAATYDVTFRVTGAIALTQLGTPIG